MSRTERNGFDRLRMLRRLARPIEVVQIRWFGASLISLATRTPVLILHTTGRRTGIERQTPIAFHRGDDRSWSIVGGASGQTRVPDWVANVRAEGDVTITVDRRRVEVRAEELVGEERRAVWAELADVWPRIEVYEQRAGRPVPVFRLIRR